MCTVQVTFSFPDFPSNEGGVPASYTWSVGTEPGAGNVLPWTSFQGINVTRSAQVQDGSTGQDTVISQTVHLVDWPLPGGLALQQGGSYYVSVRGTNAGGAHHSLVVHSSKISVSGASEGGWVGGE